MSKWNIHVKEAERTSAFHPGYMWYAISTDGEYLENTAGFMNHQSAVQDAINAIELAKVMCTEKEYTAGVWSYEYG